LEGEEADEDAHREGPHGVAEAVKVVSEAANQYFMENAQLNKKLDVIRDTFAQQTKIIVPSSADILSVVGLEGAQVLPIKASGKDKKSSSA